jgi:hypothetical protein
MYIFLNFIKKSIQKSEYPFLFCKTVSAAPVTNVVPGPAEGDRALVFAILLLVDHYHPGWLPPWPHLPTIFSAYLNH